MNGEVRKMREGGKSDKNETIKRTGKLLGRGSAYFQKYHYNSTNQDNKISDCISLRWSPVAFPVKLSLSQHQEESFSLFISG